MAWVSYVQFCEVRNFPTRENRRGAQNIVYLLGHVQKLVQVRSAVGELAESPLPLHMFIQLDI